jgi:hypothetical protein
MHTRSAFDGTRVEGMEKPGRSRSKHPRRAHGHNTTDEASWLSYPFLVFIIFIIIIINDFLIFLILIFISLSAAASASSQQQQPVCMYVCMYICTYIHTCTSLTTFRIYRIQQNPALCLSSLGPAGSTSSPPGPCPRERTERRENCQLA